MTVKEYRKVYFGLKMHCLSFTAVSVRDNKKLRTNQRNVTKAWPGFPGDGRDGGALGRAGAAGQLDHPLRRDEQPVPPLRRPAGHRHPHRAQLAQVTPRQHSIRELETKAVRRFAKISQSLRRPLLGPSPV